MRVLIVDDSVTFRSQIKKALEMVPGVDIVGAASNGLIALQILQQKMVDLIIIDLNMPDMDGLMLLEELKKLGFVGRLRSLVFASQTGRSAKDTVHALSLGASDFVLKPKGDHFNFEQAYLHIAAELVPKVIQFIQRPLEPILTESNSVNQNKTPYESINLSTFQPEAIALASSTGGPRVLEQLFSYLRQPLNVPIFIVQHMPPLFTQSLAARLSDIAGVDCKEGVDGELIKPGRVYIAPGNYHMTIANKNSKPTIHLNQENKVNEMRPAADPLLTSLAEVYGHKSLGIILTGMGADGKEGAEAIKNVGGAVFIQDRESSTVWGMPGAVYSSGAYDEIMNIEACGKILARLAGAS